jgi:hypothetical protein
MMYYQIYLVLNNYVHQSFFQIAYLKLSKKIISNIQSLVSISTPDVKENDLWVDVSEALCF